MKQTSLLKRMFLLYALVAGSMSVWADDVTISFNETGTSSDASTKLSTIAEIINEGADHVSAIAKATNVYKGRTGRGVKLGSGKAIGELELTLSKTIKPSKIVVKARKYNDKGENYININGNEFTLSDGTADDCEITYDGNTDVSSINIKTTTTSSKYRTYVISITIYLPVKTSYEYTTFVTTNAANFTGTGLEAYVATAASASSVTMTDVATVPAGTPLVLKNADTSKTYDVPVPATATAPATNLLKAGDGLTPVGGDGKWDYILNGGKFYHVSPAGEVAVGKAYLHLESQPSTARELNINWGETTGISSLTPDPSPMGEGSVYDLSGRRVDNPTKGIYIMNGKKYVVK